MNRAPAYHYGCEGVYFESCLEFQRAAEQYRLAAKRATSANEKQEYTSHAVRCENEEALVPIGRPVSIVEVEHLYRTITERWT